MSLEIRPLCAEDFEAARALWCFMDAIALRADDTPEAFERFLARNPESCYAAWQGGDLLVGAIMAGHDGRRGYLYHLVVKPKFRKQGIGKALVAHAVNALHAQGIQKCHVFVKRHNLTAKSFWQQLGWELRKDIQVNSLSL
jgi:ribosomal protein S18 acetylase RimI-like enzyme